VAHSAIFVLLARGWANLRFFSFRFSPDSLQHLPKWHFDHRYGGPRHL